jgi:hypothetical protein
MKRTILNLVAIAALSFSGMALAVDDVEPKAMPVDEGAGQTVMPVDEVAGQAMMPEEAAPQAVMPEEATPQAVTPAEAAPQATAPEAKPIATNTHRDIPTKRNRSRSLDLRYCLEQGSNVAIATCAGEK